MDLRQLECFLAVADELHFGQAAKRLHLGQPTVSECIRRLERSLGAPLFDRTTRHVVLTDFGVAFRAEAGAAYHRVEEAFETGRELARRTPEQFAVGYAADLGPTLVRLVPALQQRLPSVTMTLHAMTTLEQMEALHRRRLHVGICWLPEPVDELTSTVLDTSPLVAIVPDGHPLARRRSIGLARLATEPLIGWPRSLNPRMYDAFATAMDGVGEPWALVGTAIGMDNVLTRVVSGHGVGVAVRTSAVDRPFPGTTYVGIYDGPVLERHLVWRADERNPAVTVFVELVAALIAERREHDATPPAATRAGAAIVAVRPSAGATRVAVAVSRAAPV